MNKIIKGGYYFLLGVIIDYLYRVEFSVWPVITGISVLIIIILKEQNDNR